MISSIPAGRPHGKRWALTAAGTLLSVLLATADGRAAGTGEEIGVVVAAKQATGTLSAEIRKLAKGDAVHRAEVLATGKSGSGEFKLNDDTKIALGPGARLTLDEAVYDPAEGTPAVVLTLIEGAFRFLTGKLDHSAYKIKAGGASLAVRGTVFDVYVDAEGGVAVLLHDGGVDICGAGNACREHRTLGRVIHVSRAGILSDPLEWNDRLMPGIPLKRAFPFLARRLAIDPVRRLGSVAVVTKAPVKVGTKVVRKAGRTVRKATRRIRRVLRSPF